MSIPVGVWMYSAAETVVRVMSLIRLLYACVVVVVNRMSSE